MADSAASSSRRKRARSTPTPRPMASTFTALRARTNAGEELTFDCFADKVVLVVNVARL